MKLITEVADEVNYISEAREDGKKNWFVEGIILQGGITNRNQRVYPEGVLANEVSRYVRENIDTKRAVGELGHPSGPNINQERISHKFINLRQEGKNWVGKAQILESLPMGAIAKGLLEADVRIGISSRGMGSLKLNKEGVNEVQSDFRLATAGDLVHDPSAPDAFLNGIMENCDWIYDEKNGWKAFQVVEEQKKEIDKNYSRLTEDHKLKMFERFLKSIG